MPEPLYSLADLPAGTRARLRRRELEALDAGLLAAMGLTDGCRIHVRSAGDPTIVEVRTTRIGLARALARRVIVEVG